MTYVKHRKNKWTKKYNSSELNTNIKDHLKYLPRDKKELKDQVILNICQAQTMSSPD